MVPSISVTLHSERLRQALEPKGSIRPMGAALDLSTLFAQIGEAHKRRGIGPDELRKRIENTITFHSEEYSSMILLLHGSPLDELVQTVEDAVAKLWARCAPTSLQSLASSLGRRVSSLFEAYGPRNYLAEFRASAQEQLKAQSTLFNKGLISEGEFLVSSQEILERTKAVYDRWMSEQALEYSGISPERFS